MLFWVSDAPIYQLHQIYYIFDIRFCLSIFRSQYVAANAVAIYSEWNNIYWKLSGGKIDNIFLADESFMWRTDSVWFVIDTMEVVMWRAFGELKISNHFSAGDHKFSITFVANRMEDSM